LKFYVLQFPQISKCPARNGVHVREPDVYALDVGTFGESVFGNGVEVGVKNLELSCAVRQGDGEVGKPFADDVNLARDVTVYTSAGTGT
jgi:hypothetical protein